MGVGAAGVSMNSKSSDVSDTACDIPGLPQNSQWINARFQLSIWTFGGRHFSLVAGVILSVRYRLAVSGFLLIRVLLTRDLGKSVVRK